MDDSISIACAIAKALTAGKTTAELARLQLMMQTVTSLIASELACRKLSEHSSALPKSGASQ